MLDFWSNFWGSVQRISADPLFLQMTDTSDLCDSCDTEPSDQTENHQMNRIEKVEKVFQPQTALSIVQVAENKRRRGICFPGDRGGACKALNQPFIMK